MKKYTVRAQDSFGQGGYPTLELEGPGSGYAAESYREAACLPPGIVVQVELQTTRGPRYWYYRAAGYSLTAMERVP